MFAPVKFTISAPGKVILFGEHSVVYGKPALVASINKRTSLIFETVPSNSIQIEFADLNWKIELPIHEHECFRCGFGSSDADIEKYLIKQEANDVTNLKNSEHFSVSRKTSLKCVFLVLRELFSGQKISTGFKMIISTELCMGAGTGSSASFSVCLTAALYQYRRILQTEGKGNSEDLAHFSSTDKDDINRLARECEQIIHGKASGLDNLVCTHGFAVEMRPAYENQDTEFEMLPEPPKLRILLVNTGVSRNTSVLVKKVAELRSSNPKIVNLVLDAMEEIVNEAGIILRQLNTNNEESFSRLENLVLLNQGLLSSLGVSHESLDNIVNITKRFGFRSKLTGAGGGGYAITFVPPSASENDIQDCVEILQENDYKVEDIIIGDKGLDLEMN